MADFPKSPFLTVDFSPKGGGIDYLGLRWVNLYILSEILVPEINNATQDLGVYCLGAWIPWKFKSICEDKPSEYTEDNFISFKEGIEIIMAESMKDDSASTLKFGKARNRIGVTQQINYSLPLLFKSINRTNATSIYAAALYGPSLKYLGFIEGNAIAKDGTLTIIPLANDDPVTTEICVQVDEMLKRSTNYNLLNQLVIGKITKDQIDELGSVGLNPSVFRGASLSKLKQSFITKFLPNDPGNLGFQRTLTARLILKTIVQNENQTTDTIRKTWYTNLFNDETELHLNEEALAIHRRKWSIFMARQYQRLILELLLRCFELGIKLGYRSIPDIVKFCLNQWSLINIDQPNSFLDLVKSESDWTNSSNDISTASRTWNQMVHPQHKSFEYIEQESEEKDCIRALTILTRWWIRVLEWPLDETYSTLFKLGERDRISLGFFIDWISDRKTLPLETFLSELFSDLIFSQHLRVALSRFDGQVQRLRFFLGDLGIEPTPNTVLSQQSEQWMDDRLKAFVNLLHDLEVLEIESDGRLLIGTNSRNFI